ncbi:MULTISPECIES: flagellar basal body-associated FliL family protein [Rhizobium/Agrobacterium group]|jgi:flagellar protein FliL|uniref:Flagellar protein FliL n=1 Tax=Rhizobium soli TaxID=424798 RepID=A0A7X0JHK3_9HYPH|nr:MULTISPECIES: flagellar basal body-associated FliL family protein [Rhizobium/Agrobacterium group]RYE63762.1 MAG: flagellar basal body-associated FliL family protein [Rhizobiaceae bacterium]MBB6507726.1 flagellar FliL protein [Rhizobium soli]MBD8652688.1 flagellar basal body-associated FliL family protein [Rhizobium sp. CFBP 13726]NSY16225.1 flagellar basal body-associated FliL family protein [Neorhizobium sp. AL 9.2.2]SEH23448.1 flagellar FliL protein [Rhizobium sp. NFR12]
MTDASLTADQPAKKKSSLVMTAAAVLGLTVVGVGGGWVVGKMIVPSPVVEEAPAAGHGAAAAPAGGGEHGAAAGASHVRPLEPIIANLAYPSDSMVRLEVSLIFGENIDEAVAASIQEDILAYMRTLSLQQIQGPRGFGYLRDDLKERAKLRSQGKVADLVFRTFIIE